MRSLGIIRCFIAVIMMLSCQGRHGSLEDRISRVLADQDGVFAVAYKNLENGKLVLLREHETFHAASTMKTPVMIEVFKQAALGQFSLLDSLPVVNEFTSIVDGSSYSLTRETDSEQQLYDQVGAQRTWRSLVYDMIISSSNLATNILIGHVDAESVTQSMRELGAMDIQVLRGVEDTMAFERGLNNTTTAYDLLLIFEKMARGEVVDSASSQAMIEILMDQRFNSILPAKLPMDVKVAHKTGSITGVHHDSGIVFLPDGRRYVLILLSKDLIDEKAATEAMATVSALIYADAVHATIH